MQVKVEQTRCILCGVCENLYPQVFQQTNVITVQIGNITDHGRLAVCEEACPMQCIEVKMEKEE